MGPLISCIHLILLLFWHLHKELIKAYKTNSNLVQERCLECFYTCFTFEENGLKHGLSTQMDCDTSMVSQFTVSVKMVGEISRPRVSLHGPNPPSKPLEPCWSGGGPSSSASSPCTWSELPRCVSSASPESRGERELRAGFVWSRSGFFFFLPLFSLVLCPLT